MTFLPIVERELRVAARRKATIWTRFFAALTVLVVGGVLLAANQRHLSAPYVGQQLFMAVSILGAAAAPSNCSSSRHCRFNRSSTATGARWGGNSGRCCGCSPS